jgi:hypothetical protein
MAGIARLIVPPRRRAAWWLVAGLLVAIALYSAPQWITLAARHALARHGVTWQSWHTAGSGAVHITGLHWPLGDDPGGQLAIDQLSIAPWSVVAHHYMGHPVTQALISAGTGTLTLATGPGSPGSINSTRPDAATTSDRLPQIIGRWLSAAEVWAPPLQISTLEIAIADRMLAIRDLRWDGTVVAFAATAEPAGHTIAGRGPLTGPWLFDIVARTPAGDEAVTARVWPQSGTDRLRAVAYIDSTSVTGSAMLSIEFLDTGFQPKFETSLAVHTPRTFLALDAQLTVDSGTIDARWQPDAWYIDAALSGQARHDSWQSATQLRVAAHGEPAGIVVSQLAIELPGIDLQLDRPARWATANRMFSEPFAASARVDLSRFAIPGLAGELAVTGSASFDEARLDALRCEVTATSTALQWQDILLDAGKLVAHWDGHTLRVAELAATWRDKAELNAAFELVPAERSLQHLTLDSRWLPQQLATTLTAHAGWQATTLQLTVGQYTLDWQGRSVRSVEPGHMFVDWSRTDPAASIGWQVQLSARGEAFDPSTTPDIDALLQLELDLAGDRNGLQIRALTLGTQQQTLVTGRGHLPLRLVKPPGGDLAWRQTDNDQLALSLDLQSPALASQWIRTFLDWDVVDPRIGMEFSGSLTAPQGIIHMAAGAWSLAGVSGLSDWQLAHPQLVATIQPDGISVDPFAAEFAGRPLRASAYLPMSAADWQALWRDKQLPQWQTGSGSLVADGLPLALLARFAPSIMLERGSFDMDLGWAPGPLWHGFIRIDGAATRPLPPGLAWQQIAGTLTIDGDTVRTEALHGRIDNHPVTLDGFVRFADGAVRGADLRLRGTALPLVRQVDFIARGDVDLRLTIDASATRLGGSVLLLNSLFLKDFRDFLQPGTTGTANRPPYFRVETPPFAEWELDLRLTGERFLRVQSPLFSGLLSARLQLLGTLGDPYALGEINLDSGTVRFPFGSIVLDDGLVRLSPANPYNPLLAIHGHSRSFGYTIDMGVSGTLDSPVLSLQSNPPLTREQILLLLTAGMVPDQGSMGADRVGQRLALYLGQGLANDFIARIDAGWSQNLTIEPTGRVSDGGRETLRIEYRLSDDLSLFAENDVFDDYSAGLRWNVFRR